MGLGFFDVELIAWAIDFILISAIFIIGLLYNLGVTLVNAPRWKLTVATAFVSAIIIFDIVLAKTDGYVGDLISSILGECIIASLAIWFLIYIIWIGKPYRKGLNKRI